MRFDPYYNVWQLHPSHDNATSIGTHRSSDRTPGHPGWMLRWLRQLHLHRPRPGANGIITNIRNWVMGILFAVAVLFLTIGAVRYLFAGG